MRVECPGCFAVFDAPEQRLGMVRTVRCCFCDHIWDSPLGEGHQDVPEEPAVAYNEREFQRFDEVLDGAELMPSDALSSYDEVEPRRGPSFQVTSDTPWQSLAGQPREEAHSLGSKGMWIMAWVGSFVGVLVALGVVWHHYHAVLKQIF